MESALFEKEISNYMKLLSPAQQNSLLQMIKSFLVEGSDEKRISVEQYNREITEAENRIASGKFITNEEAEKKSREW